MRRCFLLLVLVGCVARPSFDDPQLRPVADDVGSFAAHHMREQGIPGIWIAVLDVDPETGRERIWADSCGGGDVLATHRVASISKLFTDTAAMVLVERGVLDLDVPVTKYLPDFAPKTAFRTPITLRHLMGHRAGIVRESAVGHYFDPTEPTLEATVRSLNESELVFEPGTTFKYSNPGIGVVGEIIARVTGAPFEDAVRDLVLRPLGLRDSDFAARADLLERQSKGLMWTYDGREIETPQWRFGYVPAADLRSTVVDLVHFARSWFRDAKRRVLRPDTQEAMWRLPEGETGGCGLGFFVREFDGYRRVGHGGAVYGSASAFMALPEQGIAVAVVCSKDFANQVADAIARRALRAAIANRRGERLASAEYPTKIGGEDARALAGHWRAGDNWVEFYERGGELYYDPNIGVRTRMRLARDGSLVADDTLSQDGVRRLTILKNGNPHDGQVEYVRDDSVPPAVPAELLPLIGEYGWDHNVLIVYEDRGRLGVLIEWVVRDLPDFEGPDRYRFPPGMYNGDPLRFERDPAGKVTAAVVGGVRFVRREGVPPGGFRIRPVRPIPELTREAARATPPPQPGGLAAFDLVDLATLDKGLQFDIRYATANNFIGAALYEADVAMMQRPAAEALVRAHRSLAAHGLGLHIFDAYRPWSVTKVFFDATPKELRHFVADPAKGSRHNRGCAVDLTLYELATGKPVTMPSGFDEFTERAYPDYPGGTSRQRYYREVLRRAMEAQGFSVYEHEWWHFDYEDWRRYPIGNEPLRK